MWIVQYATKDGHTSEHAPTEDAAARRVTYLRNHQRITQVCYFEITDEDAA